MLTLILLPNVNMGGGVPADLEVPWHDAQPTSFVHGSGKTPTITRNVEVEQVIQADVDQA